MGEVPEGLLPAPGFRLRVPLTALSPLLPQDQIQLALASLTFPLPPRAPELGNLWPRHPLDLCASELTSVADSTPSQHQQPEPPASSPHSLPGPCPRLQGPTFVGAGEQPEVLRLLLEVLLPDFLI